MERTTLYYRIGSHYAWELHSHAFRAKVQTPGRFILKAFDKYALDLVRMGLNEAASEVQEKFDDRGGGGEVFIKFAGQDGPTIQRLLDRAEDPYILLFRAVNCYSNLDVRPTFIRPRTPNRFGRRPLFGGG